MLAGPGTIPIIMSAPDIEEHFNPASFINVKKYKSFDDCIEFIKQIDQSDELYQKMANEPWFIGNKLNKHFDNDLIISPLKQLLED